MAKYAVVIGVSKYPEATGEGGLKPLLRAIDDAKAFAEGLNAKDGGQELDYDYNRFLLNKIYTLCFTH